MTKCTQEEFLQEIDKLLESAHLTKNGNKWVGLLQEQVVPTQTVILNGNPIQQTPERKIRVTLEVEIGGWGSLEDLQMSEKTVPLLEITVTKKMDNNPVARCIQWIEAGCLEDIEEVKRLILEF